MNDVFIIEWSVYAKPNQELIIHDETTLSEVYKLTKCKSFKVRKIKDTRTTGQSK